MAKIVRAYIDTNIVSRLADRRRIKREELDALDELFLLHTRGTIELVRSEHVEEEIDKTPAQYLELYAKMLANFLSLRTVSVGGLTQMGLAGFGVTNPRYREFKRLENILKERLENILKDEKDRWHVFVASQNQIKYVVTLDKEMVNKTDKVLEATGVRLVLPSEFLALFREGNAIIGSRA